MALLVYLYVGYFFVGIEPFFVLLCYRIRAVDKYELVKCNT